MEGKKILTKFELRRKEIGAQMQKIDEKIEKSTKRGN